MTDGTAEGSDEHVPTADVRPVRGRLDLRSGCPSWMLRNGTGETGPRLLWAHTAIIVVLGARICSAFVTRALVAMGLKVFVLDQRCPGPGLGCSCASTARLRHETPLNSVKAETMIRDRTLGCAHPLDSIFGFWRAREPARMLRAMPP